MKRILFTLGLFAALAFAAPAAAQVICAEDFENRTLSTSGSFQVGCIPGRIDGSGSSVAVVTTNPISGSRSLRFTATTSSSRAEIVPGFTSSQLSQGVYFAYSYRADQIGTFGTKTHIVEPRGNWLQIHTDCQSGICDVTTVEHDNGTAMSETFGTIRVGEVQRWKYYFRSGGGMGTIRVWVNGVLRLDRSGSNYGGSVGEARSGHPYLTGYWNSSNRSGTLVFTMDDIVISLTDPDTGAPPPTEPPPTEPPPTEPPAEPQPMTWTRTGSSWAGGYSVEPTSGPVPGSFRVCWNNTDGVGTWSDWEEISCPACVLTPNAVVLEGVVNTRSCTTEIQVTGTAGQPQRAVRLTLSTVSRAATTPPPPEPPPAPQPPTIITASLPAGQVGEAYSATIQASGGTPPYQCSIASGAFAAGMNFSSNCALAGTPVEAGDFTFTVRVSDAASLTATREYALTIAAAPEEPPVPPEEDEKDQRIAELEAQVAAQASEIQSLESQLAALAAQVATLNSQLSTLNSQLAAAQAQVATLNSQLATLNSQLSTANAKVTTLETKLARIRAILDEQ